VDVPSVAGAILLRPTQSVGLHLQMIGRCLRPQPGKTAVILDHVGNTQRLGHHLEEREWTLDGTPKRDLEAAPSIRICPKCFSAMASAARECPDCGHEFVVERRELTTVDGELVEVQRAAGEFKIGDDVSRKTKAGWRTGFVVASLPQHGRMTICHINYDGSRGATISTLVENVQLIVSTRREQAQAATLDELIAIGRRRKMKNPAGWARHVMAARSLRSGKARVREVVG